MAKVGLCLLLIASAACRQETDAPITRDTKGPTAPQFDAMVALDAATSKPIENPTDSECRKACWNYNKVMFGAKTEKLLNGLGADEAAMLRVGRERAYQEIRKRENDPGLLGCVADCQANAGQEQVACMQAAETPEVLRGCMSH